jgi:ATP-binding cassette subfamily B protein
VFLRWTSTALPTNPPVRSCARPCATAPPRAALLLVSVLIGTAATLLLPAATGRAVDDLLGGAGAGAAAPVLALLAVTVATDMLSQFADPWCSNGTTRYLGGRLATHVLALGVPGTRRFSPGDLTGRLISGVPEAGTAPSTIIRAVTQLALSLGALVALALIDPWLAVVVLLGAPLGTVAVRLLVRQVSHSALDYQQAQSALLARMLDALVGIRTIHASGTQAQEVRRILVPLPDLDRAGRAIWESQRRLLWRTSLLLPVLQIAVLAVAGYGVSAGRTTPGDLLAAVGYTTTALGFLSTSQSVLALARSRAGAIRIAQVLAVPAPPVGTRPLPAGPGELELDRVTVRHRDTVVLDRLSLRVRAGQTVALVGRSGAGKSTLAAVAGGLVAPDDGQVRLDGIPLPDLCPADLRGAVAYAFAQPALLGGSIADALAYTDGPGPTPQQVTSAARDADADAFIRRLPDGYRTPVAGAPMSGGEAQRLGIARAVAHGGRLVILDDATSSLDTATEVRVSDALEHALAGRTRLVVAHRPATAARADLVAWIEQGRTRAVAPHRDLWRNPQYRALFAPDPATACPSPSSSPSSPASSPATETA